MGKIINEIEIDINGTPDKNIVMIHANNDPFGFKMEQIQKDIWEFTDKDNTPKELLDLESDISVHIVTGE